MQADLKIARVRKAVLCEVGPCGPFLTKPLISWSLCTPPTLAEDQCIGGPEGYNPQMMPCLRS
ncbi:hypothetical protein ACRRTK_015893 [Alexandromys fortis]